SLGDTTRAEMPRLAAFKPTTCSKVRVRSTETPPAARVTEALLPSIVTVGPTGASCAPAAAGSREASSAATGSAEETRRRWLMTVTLLGAKSSLQRSCKKIATRRQPPNPSRRPPAAAVNDFYLA